MGGYLVKVASKIGINSFGVEISEKLRNFAKEIFDLNIYKSLQEIEKTFDVIFVDNVIEHFDPDSSRNIINEIIMHLNPGGILVGAVPNYKSANILLCKDKDPVIAPPSHRCYFTPNSLDIYLKSFSLKKIKLYTAGVSTNSFFRPKPFEYSFLEKPAKNKLIVPVVIGIKTIFKIGGWMISPFGLGYKLCFVYQKKDNR